MARASSEVSRNSTSPTASSVEVGGSSSSENEEQSIGKLSSNWRENKAPPKKMSDDHTSSQTTKKLSAVAKPDNLEPRGAEANSMNYARTFGNVIGDALLFGGLTMITAGGMGKLGSVDTDVPLHTGLLIAGGASTVVGSILLLFNLRLSAGAMPQTSPA